MALRSTEGFLAADVSSAALQRDGWNAKGKKGGKKGRRERDQMTKGETKGWEGPSSRMHDIWVSVKHLHEASLGK